MPSIRKQKIPSGATAVQVVDYENRRVDVLKHIGSAKHEKEVAALVEQAHVWIEHWAGQMSLFEREGASASSSDRVQLLEVTHLFAHEVLVAIAKACGFDVEKYRLIIDLAVMRLIEPASKLRSVELLKRYFDIEYSQRAIYRTLPTLHRHKSDFQEVAVKCALDQFYSELSLVLYDVTTLYFESFSADELRTPGFSKDNKPNQPQIVVGLLVTRDGFPLGYEVFPGRTFEGKTLLSVLDEFVITHKVKRPIVVADAGMLSKDNISELKKRGFSYIMGARLGNLPAATIDQLSDKLSQKDEHIVRLETNYGHLIASFSDKRYKKHAADLKAQIKRAEKIVASGSGGSRAKFVLKAGGTYKLNNDLVAKSEKLLGIRGYYTDISTNDISDQEVISYYRDLWRVEQAFRMSKSDLAVRPIFHRKEDAIKAHLLVCFTALVMTKYIELTTKASPRAARDMLMGVKEARFVDTDSGELLTSRTPIDPDTKDFLGQLFKPPYHETEFSD